MLYACSSIQLVEQTKEKAEGYGLPVCTYYGREFSNDLYDRGLAPCVTTYQALFNGHSKFFRSHQAAIIFDDSHAAEHLLRDHFTLRLNRSSNASAYVQLLKLFEPYFEKIGKKSSFAELADSQDSGLFFVPPFVVHSVINELSSVVS